MEDLEQFKPDLKKILVFRVGHLGDTIVALPGFWAIRKAYRNATVTLLSNEDRRNKDYLSPRNILPESDLFDDWLAYPTNVSGIGKAVAVAKTLLEVRRSKFDAVFYMPPRERSLKQIQRDMMFFKWAGIQIVVGADYYRKHRLGLVGERPLQKVSSEGEFLVDCLRQNGFDEADLHISDLLLTAAEHAAAAEWLEKSKYQPGRRLVAIGCGGKRPSRIWDEERFKETVDRLIADHNIFPVILGGNEERMKGERLVDHWGTGANAAGELSVREAAALLKRCSIYLGNDTGTMHLAAAVGTRCVSIFSAADWPGQWVPAGNHKVIRMVVECEGCHLDICPFSSKCLDLVSVDEVYLVASEMLELGPRSERQREELIVK